VDRVFRDDWDLGSDSIQKEDIWNSVNREIWNGKLRTENAKKPSVAISIIFHVKNQCFLGCFGIGWD